MDRHRYVWTHGYLFNPMDNNPILSLFTLSLKLFQLWPLGTHSLRLTPISFCQASSLWAFWIFWHKTFQARLDSPYPSPRINHFCEEPSEPRPFDINLSCPFHQLMLYLKHFWLEPFVHFSQKYTLRVGEVCIGWVWSSHSASLCGYSRCFSVHFNCPAGMIQAWRGRRVRRQRSGLECR